MASAKGDQKQVQEINLAILEIDPTLAEEFTKEIAKNKP